jgi:pyruvate, water dikinase
VRSSAVGEDSASASFAGQHASELGVLPGERLLAAVQAVWRSGFCDAALGYRDRLGLDRSPSMGVVIQPLIDARLAGVLFTRNPISGAPERVIEASWGLGESVVQGRVVPDRYRLSPDGRLIELTVGDKRTEVRPLRGGGVAEHQVAAALAGTPCLDETKLRALHELTLRCEAVWPGEHDLEWAFAQNGKLHLLQRRPVTTRSPRQRQAMTRPADGVPAFRSWPCVNAPRLPSIASRHDLRLTAARQGKERSGRGYVSGLRAPGHVNP